MLADRVLTSGPTGELVEAERLNERQVLAGRATGGARPTTLVGSDGIRVVQSGDSIKVSLDTIATTLLPIASGRWTNTTATSVFRHTVDVRTATPAALQTLTASARIICTVESSTAASIATVYQRTATGFTIDFTGGLPPGSTVNWIVINL